MHLEPAKANHCFSFGLYVDVQMDQGILGEFYGAWKFLRFPLQMDEFKHSFAIHFVQHFDKEDS